MKRRGNINNLFEKETIPTPPAPIYEEQREKAQTGQIGCKYEMTGYQ